MNEDHSPPSEEDTPSNPWFDEDGMPLPGTNVEELRDVLQWMRECQYPMSDESMLDLVTELLICPTSCDTVTWSADERQQRMVLCGTIDFKGHPEIEVEQVWHLLRSADLSDILNDELPGMASQRMGQALWTLAKKGHREAVRFLPLLDDSPVGRVQRASIQFILGLNEGYEELESIIRQPPLSRLQNQWVREFTESILREGDERGLAICSAMGMPDPHETLEDYLRALHDHDADWEQMCAYLPPWLNHQKFYYRPFSRFQELLQRLLPALSHKVASEFMIALASVQTYELCQFTDILGSELEDRLTLAAIQIMLAHTDGVSAMERVAKDVSPRDHVSRNWILHFMREWDCIGIDDRTRIAIAMGLSREDVDF